MSENRDGVLPHAAPHVAGRSGSGAVTPLRTGAVHVVSTLLVFVLLRPAGVSSAEPDELTRTEQPAVIVGQRLVARVVDERPQVQTHGAGAIGEWVRHSNGYGLSPVGKWGRTHTTTWGDWKFERSSVADEFFRALVPIARAEGFELVLPNDSLEPPVLQLNIRALWCEPGPIVPACEATVQPTLVVPGQPPAEGARIHEDFRSGPLQSRPFEDIMEALEPSLRAMFREPTFRSAAAEAVEASRLGTGALNVGEYVRIRSDAIVFAAPRLDADRGRVGWLKGRIESSGERAGGDPGIVFRLEAPAGEFVQVRTVHPADPVQRCGPSAPPLADFDVSIFVRRTDLLPVLRRAITVTPEPAVLVQPRGWTRRPSGVGRNGPGIEFSTGGRRAPVVHRARGRGGARVELSGARARRGRSQEFGHARGAEGRAGRDRGHRVDARRLRTRGPRADPRPAGDGLWGLCRSPWHVAVRVHRVFPAGLLSAPGRAGSTAPRGWRGAPICGRPPLETPRLRSARSAVALGVARRFGRRHHAGRNSFDDAGFMQLGALLHSSRLAHRIGGPWREGRGFGTVG